MWSWMSASFIEPIFGVAATRTVNESDVWSLSPFFTHKNLFTKYLRYCQRCVCTSLIIVNISADGVKTPYPFVTALSIGVEFARPNFGCIPRNMECNSRCVPQGNFAYVQNLTKPLPQASFPLLLFSVY